MRSKVLEALREGPKKRSYISHVVFGRHRTAKELNAVRDLLIGTGEIRVRLGGGKDEPSAACADDKPKVDTSKILNYPTGPKS